MSGSDRLPPACGPTALRNAEVVLTSRCNLACGYCYQNAKRAGRMEWETLRAAVDLLLASQQPQVRLLLYGGEPLLELPLIRRAVEYAEGQRPAGKEIRFVLITNGTLLDAQTAAFLEARRFKVQLSFDGVPAAQQVRGAGTFALLDALLDRLRRDHPDLHRDMSVSPTITAATVGCLADSFDYFLEKGVPEVAVSMSVTPDPGWRPEMIDALDGQFARIFDRSRAHLACTGAVPFALFRKHAAEPSSCSRDRPQCSAARGGTVTVDVDGSAYGCVMFAASYQALPPGELRSRLDTLRLGGIGEPSFAPRLDGYAAAAARSGLFDGRAASFSSYGRCADCRFLGSCCVCPASLGRVPGGADLRRVPDPICAFNRVALGYRERFPAQPSILDMVSGRAPLPSLLQDLGLKPPGAPGNS